MREGVSIDNALGEIKMIPLLEKKEYPCNTLGGYVKKKYNTNIYCHFK